MIENLKDLIVKRASMNCEQYISLVHNSKGQNLYEKMFRKNIGVLDFFHVIIKRSWEFFQRLFMKKIIERSQLIE